MRKIVYARRDDGGNRTPYPVKAVPEVKGHHLSCYLCDCRVGFVSTHERTHPNDNESIIVESHFAHHPDASRKVSCKWKADSELQWNEDGTKRQKREKIVPESEEHRMGKIIVKEEPGLLFVQKCIHCKEFNEIKMNNNHPDSICEYFFSRLYQPVLRSSYSFSWPNGRLFSVRRVPNSFLDLRHSVANV